MGAILSKRAARAGCALALSVFAILVPLHQPGARAADDGLRLATSATYRLVPDERRVRVTVELTATNVTKDVTSGIFVTQSYFESLRIAVQSEATRVSATSAGLRLAVTIEPRKHFDVIDIRLADALYYQDVAKVRLSYDLPAGKPRSSSDVRVGAAFSTFVAWAFGDSGRVRIEIPAIYEVDTSGASLSRETGGSSIVLTSGGIADPAEWYAVVDATRDEALTSERLSIPSGEAIVVRGWPEDEEWVGRVRAVLTKGLPVLDELVGLPWPVADELKIVEVHTALLEGYGGFYDVERDTITVSEDLDSQVILHEAAHAWFNGDLFSGRWIGEGLADEYSAIVLGRTEQASFAPRQVKRDDPAAFALETWRNPQPIDDDKTVAYEAYGYHASWSVMREIVDRAGIEAMRGVLRAAEARQIPYQGDGPPETMSTVPDWSRLLDLVEERADVEVADVFRVWVLDEASVPLLDVRSESREAYEELVAAGDGWLPPYAVRAPMAGWQFPAAMTQIASATEILELRAEIETRAATLGVSVPPGLEAAYETAVADVAAAMPVATERLAGLSELESATEAVAEPRDLLTDVGLLAEMPPEDRLEEARDAFEAGDFVKVAARSDALEAALAAAPDVGRTRLIGGTVAVTSPLIAAVAILLVRRSSRRRRAYLSAATASAAATLPATSPRDVAGTSVADPASEGGDGPTDDGRIAPG